MGAVELNPCLGRPSREGWLLPLPRGAAPPASLLHLLGGPELHLFMLPRIPGLQTASPAPAKGRTMFSRRAAARAFIPHTALPRQSVPQHPCLSAQLTACSWRDGSLPQQGNGSSAQVISLSGSQDQCSSFSVCSKEQDLLKRLPRTGSALTSLAVITQPGEPSPKRK